VPATPSDAVAGHSPSLVVSGGGVGGGGAYLVALKPLEDQNEAFMVQYCAT